MASSSRPKTSVVYTPGPFLNSHKSGNKCWYRSNKGKEDAVSIGATDWANLRIAVEAEGIALRPPKKRKDLSAELEEVAFAVFGPPKAQPLEDANESTDETEESCKAAPASSSRTVKESPKRKGPADAPEPLALLAKRVAKKPDKEKDKEQDGMMVPFVDPPLLRDIMLQLQDLPDDASGKVREAILQASMEVQAGGPNLDSKISAPRSGVCNMKSQIPSLKSEI